MIGAQLFRPVLDTGKTKIAKQVSNVTENLGKNIVNKQKEIVWDPVKTPFQPMVKPGETLLKKTKEGFHIPVTILPEIKNKPKLRYAVASGSMPSPDGDPFKNIIKIKPNCNNNFYNQNQNKILNKNLYVDNIKNYNIYNNNYIK